MAGNFPIFLNIENKKIEIFGAGRIASRRAEALLAFGPVLTVYAPEASEKILELAGQKKIVYHRKYYQPGMISEDTWMVLAATDCTETNVKIAEECRGKGILVNVCSDRELCDFQFPGLAVKDDLVIGVNAGGEDHQLAKKWTDRLKREVEADGYGNQAQKTSHDGESS